MQHQMRLSFTPLRLGIRAHCSAAENAEVVVRNNRRNETLWDEYRKKKDLTSDSNRLVENPLSSIPDASKTALRLWCSGSIRFLSYKPFDYLILPLSRT